MMDFEQLLEKFGPQGTAAILLMIFGATLLKDWKLVRKDKPAVVVKSSCPLAKNKEWQVGLAKCIAESLRPAFEHQACTEHTLEHLVILCEDILQAQRQDQTRVRTPALQDEIRG
jgi:hypothetical protein